MNPNFLLTSPLAQKLYQTCAKDLPIIDYHNHLAVAELTDGKKGRNITQIWVRPDPYKHRAMRILGVQEHLITGESTDYEKFRAWYECLPRLIGNPLFDWSCMELSRVFGYELLPFKAPEQAWEELNRAAEAMTTADILDKFSIEYSAPCAALCDALEAFSPAKGICPSLRGDDLLLPGVQTIEKLESLTGMKIADLDSYFAAVRIRLDAFRAVGCRFTDHALDNGFTYRPDDGKNAQRFADLLAGNSLSQEDKTCLTGKVLSELMSQYASFGFTVQLHIGAQRTTSTRLRTIAGPAGGYAAIGSTVDVLSLTNFLDAVEQSEHGMPRVLLFTLNPADNAVMATLSGSYSKDGYEAFVSQGPAWWWCDHYEGMTDMLDTFVAHSVLSTFIGMTTDSRSVLSFVRHDYFRRILCQWIADKVSCGRMPEDEALLCDLIRRVCYQNAKNRLGE